ncbi:exosome nuclease subunit [Knufia obscura]|uniref:Exosome nuclease subunit n=2 Tax=Knufia TaxID=430999 RepID=A0AAN8IC57_9EURO|nr:exosome nuclease subunit [Knufia obscura]KAK5958011.1 exosome nuclease subunit [Knufia fluminis]
MSTDLPADFKTYQDRVTSSLVNVTRSAGSIASHDLSFHRSLSDKVNKSLDSQNAHLLRLTSKLLKAATKETNIKTPLLQDRDSVDDNWRKVVDVIDDLLEKADANLDEFNGLIKRQSPSQAATPEPPATKSRFPTNYSTAYGVIKPQTQFETAVDNYDNSRWRPLLREKPHAQIPLEESIGSQDKGYNHPYQYEIENLEYPPSVYKESLPTPFTRPENTEAIWVDTEEGVMEMLEELKQAKEIAIDLEHNDRNSYVGMVCLMQVSTRSKDWVVDTLRPWRENLQVLNEVFADPNIVKVFHGSASDMVWLQRDLGLYVVGLFDTYHAANALQYPHRSLAYLLQKFANVIAQKQYQLADWRVRPLPQELLDYARSDTHYLLYIYDNMRNELIRQSTPEKNLVDYVLTNSKKESLQVFERRVYDPENGLGPNGWIQLLLTRNVKSLDKQQFAIFRNLHEWRDSKARELDEGISSIMSNAYLWSCAENKPETRMQLFNPRLMAGRASYFVGQHWQEVLDKIKEAKPKGVDGPTVQEVLDRNADKLASFRQFKHANPNAKPQEVQQSVAATMQKLVQTGELQDGITSEAVSSGETLAGRSVSSSFWGAMKPVASQPVLDSETAQMALKSVMPFQTLVNGSGSAAETNGAPTSVASDLAPLPPQPTNGEVRIVDEPDIDVPFTLSGRKKKRAADEIDPSEEMATFEPKNPEDFAITDEGTVLTQKQARQAFKKAKKAADQAERNAEATNVQPFDYTNAPSMLHPQPDPLSTYKDSNPAKPFNPFAKALDTSTGARRNKFGKEMAGKSHTFRS